MSSLFFLTFMLLIAHLLGTAKSSVTSMKRYVKGDSVTFVTFNVRLVINIINECFWNFRTHSL